MNRVNLEKLGRYLAQRTLKYNEKHFNMNVFFTHRGQQEPPDGALDVIDTHWCGTAACAMGHIPVLFRKETVDYITHAQYPNWYNLGAEVLGVDQNDAMRLWSFLFDPDWSGHLVCPYDRTSFAAADRIAYVLYEHEGDFEQENKNLFDSEIRVRHMPKAYGAAKRAGWIRKERMIREDA